MEKFSDYFLDKNGKKRTHLIVKNKNRKLVTFSDPFNDLNHKSFTKMDNLQLLKIQLIGKNIMDDFFRIRNHFSSDLVSKTFWVIKKGNYQYVGNSPAEFKRLIKMARNSSFAFPLITEDVYIILSRSQLNLYFNNDKFPYLDLIEYYSKLFYELSVKSKFNIIGKIDINKEGNIKDFAIAEDIPKLDYTMGWEVFDNYFNYFYVVKRPNLKNKIIMASNMSKIIVWADSDIRYNEKRKFFFHRSCHVELDELHIYSIKAIELEEHEDFPIFKRQIIEINTKSKIKHAKQQSL